MAGSGEKILIQPADIVMVTSHASGTSVTQASRARPLFTSTVVPTHSALSASAD